MYYHFENLPEIYRTQDLCLVPHVFLSINMKSEPSIITNMKHWHLHRLEESLSKSQFESFRTSWISMRCGTVE